ncbi:hypothetical protein P1P75_31970 [Streptomyces sp. ID05-39B]|nr:hypothetical protein [Streptomyces sp. ID05-39B]MDX3530901.1 hypothetical protein [Streptomyces sp. ID05-39B]
MHLAPAQPYVGTHDREIDSLAEFDEVARARRPGGVDAGFLER